MGVFGGVLDFSMAGGTSWLYSTLDTEVLGWRSGIARLEVLQRSGLAGYFSAFFIYWCLVGLDGRCDTVL